ELSDQFGRSRVEALLQAWALLLEVPQHGAHGRQHERMPNEGACEKCHTDLGEGIVPELPHAPIEGVHKSALARENTDGHSAGDDLAVGGQIGTDAEHRLAATLVDTKAGDDLVKNESRSGSIGDIAEFLQELDGLQGGVPALDRLN